MIRTNKAAVKSAKAIGAGTVLSAAYAFGVGQDLIMPVCMGVAAMVGICTYLFYYSNEK